MTEPNPMAAEILEASAAGYAAAATHLMQRSPGRDGSRPLNGSAVWKAHLTERVLELAAAVRVAEPLLFGRRIAWLRRAFRARGADESELKAAIASLREALETELPTELRAAVEPALQLAANALEGEPESDPTALDSADPGHRLALEYLKACLEGTPNRAIELILDAIGRPFTPEEICTRVLIPAQREVGQLWHTGDVAIGEERIVSETTTQLLTLITAELAPQTGNGKLVLAASVAGNTHDLGVRTVATLFRLAGWRCLFLGASVPGVEIANMARSYAADLVVLTATLTTHLKELTRCVAALREVAPDTKILVGGSAFEASTTLWRQVGADAFAASIESAVAAGAAATES
jgi:MerR family transcriptional regulator, light-induced transcriptional regulator